MAEKEIRIGFSDVKMEALEFFLKESNTTVEAVLKEHLDKTYEKNVPQQVRKFVESKMVPLMEEAVQNEVGSQRQPKGQGGRGAKQNVAKETVQENTGLQQVEERNVLDAEQELESGMTMEM